MLTFDDERSSLTESLDKYSIGIPPIQWLPWIPQLLTCLARSEGKLVLNLLSQVVISNEYTFIISATFLVVYIYMEMNYFQVGRMFPQAVYFPIRTLYLTWKIEQMEQRERYKSAELAASNKKVSTFQLKYLYFSIGKIVAGI